MIENKTIGDLTSLQDSFYKSICKISLEEAGPIVIHDKPWWFLLNDFSFFYYAFAISLKFVHDPPVKLNVHFHKCIRPYMCFPGYSSHWTVTLQQGLHEECPSGYQNLKFLYVIPLSPSQNSTKRTYSFHCISRETEDECLRSNVAWVKFCILVTLRYLSRANLHWKAQGCRSS